MVAATTSQTASVVCCRAAAHSLIWAGVAEVSALRRQPGRLRAGTSPVPLLRHADDQTVVGLAAVLHAIEGSDLDADRLSPWGLVAAPRFPGRARLAAAFAQYAVDGAWGVSPHLVPHDSLHSMAGTISQALKLFGPNLGAGGGSDGARAAFLAAMALLGDGRLPGVWVVATGWVPELVLGRAGVVPAEPGPPNHECWGLALALAMPHTDWRGPTMRFGVGGGHPREPGAPFDAIALEEWLAVSSNEGRSPRRGCWSLGEGVWIELEEVGRPAGQATQGERS